MPSNVPTGPAELEYITIGDFSPGIHSSWHNLGDASPAPPGAAQVSGTYGCVANSQGALIPGPRRVRQYFDSDQDTIANLPPTEAKFRILAFRNATSMNIGTNFTTLTYTYQPNEDAVATGYKNQVDATTNLYQSIDETVYNGADHILVINVGFAGKYAYRFNTAAFSLGSNVVQYIDITTIASGTSDPARNYGPERPTINVSGVSYSADTYTDQPSSLSWSTGRWYTNPATGLAWTQADIQSFDSTNEVEVHLQRTTSVGQHLYMSWMNVVVLQGTSGEAGSDPDQGFYGFQWYATDTAHASYKLKSRVKTYKFWDTAASTYTASTVTTSNTVSATSTFPYGFISLDQTRSNTSAPTSAGSPVMEYAIYPNNEAGIAIVKAYPSNATPSTDSIANVGLSNLKVARLFAHQDRMFAVVDADVESFGTGGFIGYETLRATATNDYSNDSGTNTTFVSEAPSAIGAANSSNASEAVIIKQDGGGYVIRGDISNPTIVRLPGLPSAQILHVPTSTQLGMCYGTRNGVKIWTGGDTTAAISSQLEYDFWYTEDTEKYLGPRGSFSFMDPYIFTPNAFIYDIIHNSWWRLKDTTDYTYAWYDTSSSGRMLCVPPYMTSDIPICDWYDILEGTSDYAWTSHPLPHTHDRVCDFREIIVIAQGEGTINVTLKGLDGNTVTEEFTIASPQQPKAYRAPTQMTAEDIICQLSAMSTNTNLPAPGIYRVLLGYQQGATVV